jgi:GNAT superfamily N-acetyltransferase
MIREAMESDFAEIATIIAEAVQEMRAENSDQWNEQYPAKADFLADINRGELYVDESDEEPGRIRGVACINEREPEEYGAAAWSRNGRATVIHRLAVARSFRNKGVAGGLLRFAEEAARKNASRYLRSDTYSRNVRMNALFAGAGYRRTGTIRFPARQDVFFCYDKILE